MQQTQVVVTPIERAYEVSHVKTENICDQSQRTGNDQPYYTFCLNWNEASSWALSFTAGRKETSSRILFTSGSKEHPCRSVLYSSEEEDLKVQFAVKII